MTPLSPTPPPGFGDLLPEMVCRPPGPRTRALATELARVEAPGINTLFRGETRLVVAEACGANLRDVDGNRYVDLTAGFGVAAVGHRHPEVIAAVERQAGALLHSFGDVYAHPARIAAARDLARHAPFADARIYWAVSGADAVEIALKTARLATGAEAIVAFEPAYHGLTLGALRGTSRPAFRAPFDRPLTALTTRFSFGGPLEPVARRLASAPPVGACLVEPMVGREGIIPPPAGWLAELAELCRRHQVLTIADEVFTGVGRTGTFWASDAESLRPDLLCCGKAIGGGMPIAAAVASTELFAEWGTAAEDPACEARHTATFVAHPPACAAVSAVLEVVAREGLVDRCAHAGRALGDTLRALAGGRTVRGRGLAWALVAHDAREAGRWVDGLLDRGVVALAGGPERRVLQITPPLTIAPAQIDCALTTLAEVVAG